MGPVRPVRPTRTRSATLVKAVKPSSKLTTAKASALLVAKVKALRLASSWQDIVDLINGSGQVALSSEIKAAYCRAVYHINPDIPVIDRAKAFCQDLKANGIAAADFLICEGALAALQGDYKLAADRALAAMKATEYKDMDALALLQSSQAKSHTQASGSQVCPLFWARRFDQPFRADHLQDLYAILSVAPSAPIAVIKAAHAALDYTPESSEALAANEALRILCDPSES